MLKRALILLILALAQTGCDFQYEDRYKVAELSDAARADGARLKRELLQLEELRVGTGPVAAWGRRISADIEVRYVDGTLIYTGPIFTIYGFFGMPETSIIDDNLLPGSPWNPTRTERNDRWGRRRMVIDRKLVCISLQEDAAPDKTCHLVSPRRHRDGVVIRKQTLVVEATLNESCSPIKLIASVYWIGFNVDIWCRNEDLPRPGPSLPI